MKKFQASLGLCINTQIHLYPTGYCAGTQSHLSHLSQAPNVKQPRGKATHRLQSPKEQWLTLRIVPTAEMFVSAGLA